MNTLRKTMAVLLSIVMLLTLAPLGSFATETEPCNHLFEDNTYYLFSQKNCVNCGEPLPLPPASQIRYDKLKNNISQDITHIIFGNYANYQSIVSGEGVGLSFDETSVKGFAVGTTYYVLNMNPDEPMMTINTLAYIFESRRNLKSVDFANLLDISYVYSAQGTFYVCSSLEEVLGISNWDSDRLLSINKMFYNCSKLTSIDLSALKMTNVTDMSSAFYNCKALTALTLCPDMNSSKATTMAGMFYFCDRLEELDMQYH